MIKTILGLVIRILKNKTYMAAAKEVWGIVDEKFRITEKADDKLKSKAEEFNKLLITKFPELTEEDVMYFRQAVAGAVNKDKEALISNSDLLKQLQDTNANLLTENAELKNKISQIQTTVSVTQEAANTEGETVQA
ncbi:hypothetical protein [Clostridium saccharobutylicum]|uniref:Uncharacterized protein n=1 Tax=Clostridium saccharobutylicum DSM 13864 TaxID=1345695 RepID=U5MR30_CLOSA|nr:hypothetical protein [Clostridium saccharobutylicum]AGX43264.1 hypothetical protein CLSA_c22890 [Clostridium saccharobutylicum DSM 13864]AQR90564.1 hypothetical protein CLOSC_22850 [Clostridium saccharobutylicum]AQS00468.1 hypothetical protein CSACC_22920 [Clostridium saccharobutylicum]AQS10118.1 hypothetical protein CLOBY_22610 [Clostridium saccharobutylicum]AQS14451.1 hypothetical protein CLOSACC_22920 [Clostridium saccharobutylicum]